MPHDKGTSTTPLVEQIKSFDVIPGERDLIEQIITYAGYEFIVTTNDGNTLQGSNDSIVKAYDHYHMRLVIPIPNSKRMNTQRIPLGQIFKIELTPRAELQRRISENAHKLIVIQHQHEGKVETTKGTLMGYNRIDILDHEVCLATEEKLVSIKLSEILHLDFEDENPHIVNFWTKMRFQAPPQRKKNHRSKLLRHSRNQQGCQNKLYPRQSHHQSPQQRRAHNKDGVYRHQKRRLTPTK